MEGVAECQARALLDTGAEVSLIKKGLIPESAFRDATSPLRLIAANNLQVEGGEKEVELEIRFQGVDLQTRKKRSLHIHTVLVEAEIEEDVILSYRWMGEWDVRVGRRPHGVWISASAGQWWVAGIRTRPQQRANARLPRAPVHINKVEAQKPRAQDLFCGRKSAAKVLEEWGFEVTTLDNDPNRQPTIRTDILEWNCERQFPPGYFQLVVACPPCTEYSAALTKRVPDMETADKIVRRTLEVIRHLDPPTWWLETPRNGRLPKRKLVEDLPYVDVDYCRFEDCGYQKPTRFFGSEHVVGL